MTSTAEPASPVPASERGRGSIGPLRPVIIALIVLQLLIPAVMFGLRLDDPSRGQAPFGWQMHTTCWGSDAEICDR